MDVERLRAACLGLAGAYEDYPFGPEIAVFRVRVPGGAAPPGPGRIFALVRVEVEPLSISLKCDPALAVQLRSAHPEITGAWHLNKKHWNGVRLDGTLDEGMLRDLIEDSYDLVVSSLPAVQRAALGWLGR
ncbi:MmcQ/YjbR family DNA-binding protein [Arthrobacter bussei]|uniref:MmcQ/YjbR family DNA-binding protein n=1 Tax=Arthrobacter bussei TaxID=2594179 RepID=A0A7X1NQ55_9MICC|nr:MmcQ/YjbR family DNA-binding protein [Arthrobacter bussei]MPY10911.1 MmcQ/YjbR family DNA-binding protein [Arthrobacter bussei]